MSEVVGLNFSSIFRINDLPSIVVEVVVVVAAAAAYMENNILNLIFVWTNIHNLFDLLITSAWEVLYFICVYEVFIIIKGNFNTQE